jgi:hypothetical protein
MCARFGDYWNSLRRGPCYADDAAGGLHNEQTKLRYLYGVRLHFHSLWYYCPRLPKYVASFLISLRLFLFLVVSPIWYGMSNEPSFHIPLPCASTPFPVLRPKSLTSFFPTHFVGSLAKNFEGFLRHCG